LPSSFPTFVHSFASVLPPVSYLPAFT
jgi:hypothetical protein